MRYDLWVAGNWFYEAIKKKSLQPCIQGVNARATLEKSLVFMNCCFFFKICPHPCILIRPATRTDFISVYQSDLPLVLILSVYTDQTCHLYWFYQCILIRPATCTDFISVYWSDLPLVLILSVYTDQTCHLYWFYQCMLIRPATHTDFISVYWSDLPSYWFYQCMLIRRERKHYQY